MRAGEQNLVERLQALNLEESRLQSVATQQQQEKEAIEAARQELSNQEANFASNLLTGDKSPRANNTRPGSSKLLSKPRVKSLRPGNDRRLRANDLDLICFR